MLRTDIAVAGSPPSGSDRVEVHARPGAWGLLLDDAAPPGAPARLLTADHVRGTSRRPVVAKLQRDDAASAEDRCSAAAQLDAERHILTALHRNDAAARYAVRTLPLADSDSLPPSILCARGRHALAPRCPACRDPGAAL